NFLRLAVSDADHSVGIPHDDERREAETTAALDDLGDAVDRDDVFDELILVVAPTAAAFPALAARLATGRRPGRPGVRPGRPGGRRGSLRVVGRGGRFGS